MKKFLLKVPIFMTIFAAIDYLVGKVMSSPLCHAKGGDTKRMECIANELTDDVVVFGSSRAIHHYDPFVLQDSLKRNCYNVGRDGNGIIFNYGQYRLMSARYTPKVLIYDIQTEFDLKEDDKTKYLDWLKRYYDSPGIDSIFWNVDGTLRIKMLSQTYRYNGSFLQIISDCIHPIQQEEKGFSPLDATMNYEPKKETSEESLQLKLDSMKIYYWHRLIRDCKRKGTILIFALSPQYHAVHDCYTSFIKKMAKDNDIPLIDFYTNATFSNDRKLFADPVHMNRRGATEYSKAICGKLKLYLRDKVI